MLNPLEKRKLNIMNDLKSLKKCLTLFLKIINISTPEEIEENKDYIINFLINISNNTNNIISENYASDINNKWLNNKVNTVYKNYKRKVEK